ncbi:VCBS repeat-containing protein [Anditalea andensis]|nr:VCBS repeat-containing protein [Anditalea andensis]
MQTGLNFNNQLDINEDFNILNFDYIYNGGGLAIGDFNNDGLPDIFFVGNMVSCRLFINNGDLKFTDISPIANIETNSWAEGVTLIDINHDGLLDIYVSVSNQDDNFPDPNLLFVNQGINSEGIPVFKEMAAAYGIDDRGFNTQAAFFDFDRDGFLDLYILSNALEAFQRNTSRQKEVTGKGKSNDKLYRNNGDGTFTQVTHEAGILIEGYGLGLAISDFNRDGYPDIYVANDFITNDVLYINNQDGTFTNQIDQMIRHQSFNAMGVDVADFNNDGLVDIVTLDMFPPDNLRQKTMFSPTENYDLYMSNLDRGYEPQYVRNSLQLNRGNGRFSEIGFLSGVAQTDWSWAPLLADFNNDGYRDLFISNGYGKDVTDLDHINFTQSLGPFTTVEERRALLLKGLSALKEVRLPNYIYENNKDLTFSDQSIDWGFVHASISNGAVYSDLDNDGDLDLVINNLNEEAFLYKNRLMEMEPEGNSYLKVKIKGPKTNTMGLGAVLELTSELDGKTQTQFYEHYPTRGYKSFVEPTAHFGLGPNTAELFLKVTWPDGRQQELTGIEPNRPITVDYVNAIESDYNEETAMSPIFAEIAESLGIQHSHQHRSYKDFNRQVLLPHKHSENGPGMAVGDVNGDGLDDLFVGGSAGFPRTLFLQTQDGLFIKKELFVDDNADDMGCLLVDIDHDGDLDLYVVSGGSRYAQGSPHYQDRLYVNDGKGNFSLLEEGLPETNFSGSVVTGADIDGDGNIELFVGGRIMPGEYPKPLSSALLKYRNGKYEEVSRQYIPDLENIGMVTGAIWTDFDQDGLVDLIVVGEWMPITFFKQGRINGKTTFKDVSDQIGPKLSEGWWNSIYSVGIDQDGKPEYILGNFGKNIRWQADEEHPLIMLADDFDGNGSIDPVMFGHLVDGMYPVASRNMLVSQVPSWRNRFLKYNEFAKINFNSFFTEEEKRNALELRVHEFSSVAMKMDDSGNFQIKPLPMEAQFSPIYGIYMDQYSDLVFTVGNFYGNETVSGRYDASLGTVMDGRTNETIKVTDSGFLVSGEGRSLAGLSTVKGQTLLAVQSHQGPLQIFKEVGEKAVKNFLPLEKDDFRISFFLKNGMTKTLETPYGSGYLSQSTRTLTIPENCQNIKITKFNGESRTREP